MMRATRRAATGMAIVSGFLTAIALATAVSRTVVAQQPVFRAETRLIVETVTVKDKEGRAVEGLTAKDFAITEDGEPQQIAFVEFQRLAPTSAPTSQTAMVDKPIAPIAPVAPAAPVQSAISG